MDPDHFDPLAEDVDQQLKINAMLIVKVQELEERLAALDLLTVRYERRIDMLWLSRHHHGPEA